MSRINWLEGDGSGGLLFAVQDEEDDDEAGSGLGLPDKPVSSGPSRRDLKSGNKKEES